MNTESLTDVAKPTALDGIVRRATALYSLPAVAAEVIELTNNPQVDAHALKKCIEVDPALTAKLLRVVNSSLFGLSREVNDLNQAIALLGTKPLKLLVLGFSLPEALFYKVAKQQLQRYWTTTLARAVAAREISEQLWQRPGDDAFLAGLLQDIGMLVLLSELREPYAQLLDRTIQQRLNLEQIEFDSLGFDHTALSAEVLKHWNIPATLVAAISEKREYQRLQRIETPSGELARILHLARLLAELIAEKRLNVLPELMEAGDAYCGLDKARLTEIVGVLQPKVEQLAEVLSLDLHEATEFTEVLAEAHAQMSTIAESIAGSLNRLPCTDEELCAEISADAAQLREAVDQFLRRPTNLEADEDDSKILNRQEQPAPVSTQDLAGNATDLYGNRYPTKFLEQLTYAVGHCRSRRQPLSVLILEVGGEHSADAAGEQRIARVLDLACRELDLENATIQADSTCRRSVLLPECDRQEAVGLANTMFRTVDRAFQNQERNVRAHKYSAAAGVASVSLPVKNFPPLDLLHTAERCLAAAQSTGTCVVKSLEIY